MNPESHEPPQILVVGPDGIAMAGDAQGAGGERERPVTAMVEQPA